MKREIGSRVVVLIAMLVAAAVAKADPPAAGPTTAPATQPATQPAADVSALIRQLGDDDFHVRLEAARRLKAVGKAAEPALVEARKSEDPEVHARVEEILADIHRPPVDQSAVPQPERNANNQVYSTKMALTGNSRTMDVTEPGRTIHLEEKPGVIYMKVTGQLDGKPATREYTAKSAEQLKQEHPAAFQLYQQHFGILNQRVGMANIQLNNVVVNARIQVNGVNGGVVLAPAGVVAGDVRELMKVNLLEARLLGVMRAGATPDAGQQEVRDLLAKLRKAIPNPQKAGKEKEAAQLEYERAGDAVRSKIAELKLGNFDEMLPAKPQAGKQ